MTRTARFLVALAVSAAAASTVSCQNGTMGPSLTASIVSMQLTPSVTGVEGAQNVCCCIVTGQVKNTSSVAVHVQMSFPAVNSQGANVGTGVDMQKDVASNATRAFAASGIQAACKDLTLSQIDKDKTVRILGLWEYPQ